MAISCGKRMAISCGGNEWQSLYSMFAYQSFLTTGNQLRGTYARMAISCGKRMAISCGGNEWQSLYSMFANQSFLTTGNQLRGTGWQSVGQSVVAGNRLAINIIGKQL